MKSKFIVRLLVVMFVVATAWFISSNYYQLMLIRGESMLPAYKNMQLVILDKHTEDYRYGDVVAFRCKELDSVLVKRVVACPGDTVIIKDGNLYVNGVKSQVFQSEGAFEYSGLARDMLSLSGDCYFVIGDNIPQSIDSRYEQVSYVNREDIIGEILR